MIKQPYTAVFFTVAAGSEGRVEDWRLTDQKEYLYGKELIRAVFRETETNDHEHCIFCWFKLTNPAQGYCTLDRYHWICDTCFRDFREAFNWKIDQWKSEW